MTGKNTKTRSARRRGRSRRRRRRRRGTSPRRRARGRAASGRRAATSAAPKPMPPWRGPGAPKRPASQAALQPRCPMAKPCDDEPGEAEKAGQRRASRAVVARSARTRSGSVARLSGTQDRQEPPARPASPSTKPAPASRESASAGAAGDRAIPGQERIADPGQRRSSRARPGDSLSSRPRAACSGEPARAPAPMPWIPDRPAVVRDDARGGRDQTDLFRQVLDLGVPLREQAPALRRRSRIWRNRSRSA